MKKIKCSICGKEILLKESHNGLPLEGRVCYECNKDFVIPVRLYIGNKLKERNKKK